MTNLLGKCAVLKDMFENRRSISPSGEFYPFIPIFPYPMRKPFTPWYVKPNL